MSEILIRGMEMPSHCGECPFKFGYWFYDFYICAAQHGEKLHININTGIDDRCPLVNVPPHGDLIDQDALKNKHHWTDDFYETEYVEVEDIDAAPTIIPASKERFYDD